MPSALRDVRAYLATLYDEANPDVPVYEGPRNRQPAPKCYLLVGVNGIDELEAGMRSAQVVSPLSGDGWREEAGEVDSTAVAWTGGEDMTQIRDDVETLVAACEAAVNADRTLGGLLRLTGFAEVTSLDVRESRTDKGPFVEAVFTTSYSTLLT